MQLGNRTFPWPSPQQNIRVHCVPVLASLIRTTKLLQTPIILGGQGIVVEIGESLFRHKPKVYFYLRTHT